MKKLLCLILSLAMIFSLAACAKGDTSDTSEDKNSGKTEYVKPKRYTAAEAEALRTTGMEYGIITGENPEYLEKLSFTGYTQKTQDFYIRDPFIVFCDGVYFMYGSNIISPKLGNQGYSCYASIDLENWLGPYDVTYPAISSWNEYDYFWAPEVHYYNNEFYMLISYRVKATGAMGCATLKADNPLGPFDWVSDGFFTDEFFTPNQQWTIDASLYVDTDGQPWCFFTEHNVIHVAKFSDDLSELITEPVALFDRSIVSWTTNEICEAPFIYTMKDTGTLVMLWAGFNSGGYFQATATAQSVLGPWTAQSSPIFDRSTSLTNEDGGHGMTFVDRYGKLMMALHSPNEIDYNAGIIEHAKFFEVVEDTKNDCLKLTQSKV